MTTIDHRPAPAPTSHAPRELPEPAGLPIVGHALSVPAGFGGVRWMMEQARHLGGLYRLRFAGQEILVATGSDVVEEVSDEARFRKVVMGDLATLREPGGNGLVTADHGDPQWRKAHDILMPAFSLGAMRSYHDAMLEVADQMIDYWDRAADHGQAVDVPTDTTRLTLDTIGQCGFGYSFNSFDRDTAHPFVRAMERMLILGHERTNALPGTDLVRPGRVREFREQISILNRIVNDVIASRRASGETGHDDLLERMLHTPDPASGELLDDTNIRHQVLTFLIAGHETTSGLMSFALYYLTKHPAVLARAQAEVDALWGDTDRPRPSHGDVGKLSYIRQVIDESLRIWPSSIGYQVAPFENTTVGGFEVARDTPIFVLAPVLHRQPEWGPNPELFDPERFSPEQVAARPAHVYKPFGNGQRACIGKQFALHEATLVLALLVHRFSFEDRDNYDLDITSTITMRPQDFHLHLRRRSSDERRVAVVARAPHEAVTRRRASGTAVRVVYGSNLGTCAATAADLADLAGDAGFSPSISTLNDAVDLLSDPPNEPVVLVAASYNGEPTDDAAEFIRATADLEPGSLDGLQVALLGVGDRNWAATYQRIPRLLEERLTAAGATLILPRGEADASSDFAGAIDRWSESAVGALLDHWGDDVEGATITEDDDPNQGRYMVVDAAPTAADELAERHGLVPMQVVETDELVDLGAPLGRSKRFLRIRLPEHMSYRTADHLAVLPRNSDALVNRVAARLGLDLDRTVRIDEHRTGRGGVPTGRPMTLRRLLSDTVELQSPVTRSALALLVEYTQCPPERAPLHAMLDLDDAEFAAQVTETGLSVLDLLERYRACELPFERFLETTPALSPRSYSISSSPAQQPGSVDLMVSHLAADHRGGEGRFEGVGSSYLQRVRPGDTIRARVLPCREAFRLPNDDTPVVMVAAGTGLAPFRGAILDRQVRGATSPALAYLGFDHPEVDYLHRDELEAAQQQGAIDLRPTFMHAPDGQVQFVQHRIAADREEIGALLDAGARVYVCGDGRYMAPAVRTAFQEIHRDRTGASDEAAQAWFDDLVATGRYVEDVWVG